MRIVYDDTHQNEFINLYRNFFDTLVSYKKLPKNFIEYDYGMDRVSAFKITNAFKEFLSEYKFEISSNNINTSGIGNNRCYPVYYNGNPKEKQQVCNYSEVSGLYDDVYFGLKDYEKKLIKTAPKYEFGANQKGKRTI